MLARLLLKNGAGIPLLFLHGFLGMGSEWEAVCAHLPDHRCVAYDLPGHGASRSEEDFRFEPEEERFILVGYSMGGRLALRYAAAHPERIEALVLLSTHPGLADEKEKRRRLQEDEAWARLLLEVPIDEFLARWYDRPLFAPFKPDLMKRKTQDPQALAAALRRFSLAKQPRFSTENALSLVGERDELYRKLYPQGIVIPNAGHMLHLENPKAVALEIQKLCQERNL